MDTIQTWAEIENKDVIELSGKTADSAVSLSLSTTPGIVVDRTLPEQQGVDNKDVHRCTLGIRDY